MKCCPDCPYYEICGDVGTCCDACPYFETCSQATNYILQAQDEEEEESWVVDDEGWEDIYD